MQSDNINELIGAMNRAQLKMQPAKQNKENPFFKSHYADLTAVWDALDPFRQEGIVMTQSPADSPDGYIVLDTQITHTSGQWMRSRLKMRLAKDDCQGAGSGLSYARRYALGCMCGLVTSPDDDGNAASHPPTFQARPAPSIAPSIAPNAALQRLDLISPPQASPNPNTFIVPFGLNRGKPITAITDKDLDWLDAYYLNKMQDPKNHASRYLDEWESCLMAIRAEQLVRYPDANQEPA